MRAALFDIGNVLLCFSHDRMCDQLAAVTDLGQKQRIGFGPFGVFR